jgi:hypothetical protein
VRRPTDIFKKMEFIPITKLGTLIRKVLRREDISEEHKNASEEPKDNR